MITNLLESEFSKNSPNHNNSSVTNSPGDNETTQIAHPSVEPRVSKGKKCSLKKRVINYWRQMSLRQKASALALAVGIIPIASVGGVAHHVAVNSLMEQIVRDQESRTFDIGQKISLFTNHAINDANIIANSPLLADSQLSATASEEQKVTLLNNYIKEHDSEKYDNIAVFDPDGNLLYQSESIHPVDPNENYSNRGYFQRAISNKAAAVNDPEIHSSSSKYSLEVASPIQEKGTGKILGVVCVRMPLSHWKQIFQYIEAEGWEYRLIDTEGKIFDADELEHVGHTAGVDFEDLPQLQAKIQTQIDKNDSHKARSVSRVMEDIDDQEKVLVSLASIPNIEGIMSPGWKLALSYPVDEAFAPLRQLRLTLLLGSGAAGLLVGLLAAVLTNRAIVPIVAAAKAVKKIGRGELNTQLEVKGQDELASLGININKMAQKLKALVDYKAAETQRSQRLKDLTLKLSRALNSEEVFQIAVEEILSALQADRAIIYCLDKDGKGKIVAESLAGNTFSLIETEMTQLEYFDEYIANEGSGKVKAIPNIYQADLEVNHLKQIEACNVKAELIAPFSTNKQFQYLSIVHQCDLPRQWERAEIDFFAQLTSQVALSWERTYILQQQKAAREKLQQRALELLMEVEPIGKGDLTTRATVTEDEIGTLADSYNSTVESLRQIALQVQKSVNQMTTATVNSEDFAQSLSARASQQSEAIADALDRIQAMAESIHAVSIHAEQAETTFHEVLETVANGDAAMDRTVAGILDIRETVAETAKKVKRLGESSQKISKVVNLIGSFAAQTNLLALNASLEASRAGEEEHNFAIVAEEIRALAQQSAEATIEIEKIVASIQLDTKEVAKAMEEGTERVVIGTKLVDETRQSLDRVATSSKQVSNWIGKIAQETVKESQVSQEITNTISEVAAMANTTSEDAAQVSASTKELHTVAEDLEASVSQFKVQ